MTAEDFREIRNASPFVPFRIQMASGLSYSLPHRDYLAIHPMGHIATLYLPTGSACTLNISLMTELIEDHAIKPPHSNGA